MMTNVRSCAKCGLSLIDEEFAAHVCQRKAIDYKVEGNQFLYFDGFRWWKHTLTTQNGTGFGNTQGRDTTPIGTLFRIWVIRRGIRNGRFPVALTSPLFGFQISNDRPHNRPSL